MRPSRVEFLEKIKEIQKNYPELNKHQMDEYRCKYYGEVIDLYHAYTYELEKELQRVYESHHVVTNKKILDSIKNKTKPKPEVKLVEPKLPEYER